MVVYRGEIVELSPDDYYKIETKEGNIFVFKVDEIDKIIFEKPKVKEGIPQGACEIEVRTNIPGFF
jgi:hypothetical protein